MRRNGRSSAADRSDRVVGVGVMVARADSPTPRELPMDDTRAGSPAAAPPVPCCDSARGVGAGAAQRPCRPRAAPAGTGATRTESPPRSCCLSAPQLQPVYSPADGADVQVRAVGARREPPWGTVRATSSAPDAVSAGPMSAPRGAAAETLPTRVPSKTSASCSADQDRGADLRGIERGERNSVQVDRAAVGIGAAGRQRSRAVASAGSGVATPTMSPGAMSRSRSSRVPYETPRRRILPSTGCGSRPPPGSTAPSAAST